MPGCVFCEIAAGRIPADVVWQDAGFLAFSDANPQAPVHALIIPREHCTSLATATDQRMLGDLFTAAAAVARKLGMADDGYRIVVNVGADGGQTVDHLHVHVLGGRFMQWPPG